MFRDKRGRPLPPKRRKEQPPGLQGATSTKRHAAFNSEKNSCNVEGKKRESTREWQERTWLDRKPHRGTLTALTVANAQHGASLHHHLHRRKLGPHIDLNNKSDICVWID
jgi:hypothetical protein